MKTFENMAISTEVVFKHCLHEEFEIQAEYMPQAEAVILDGTRLTYHKLNSRANQLARVLQHYGVGPDILVGVYMERSLDLIVGLLAILKAGGAYVPLDPAYPQERLSFLLEDAQVSLILTQQQLRAHLSTQDVPILCLDTDWHVIAQVSPENIPGAAGAENLAYVIYTSGSTGKPKGVMVTHANVLHLFNATQPWYRFNEHDTWTLFHSYAFDFSVWEIWGALLYGGRLVIVPYQTCRSPEDFYLLLCQEHVTILNQTPGAFRQLMHAERTIGQHADLSLRFVIFGGEALELQSLRPWFQRHGDHKIQLVNMYGITETTVHVTYRALTQTDLDNNAGSVIGKPLPNMRIYLLDQNRQRVPDGDSGEMFIGGEGVACGYLNQTTLTRERFINN